MDSIKTKLPKVCFYGLYCYPVFNPDIHAIIGGWEIRMAMIARELASRGLFDVTVIVADYGQPHVEYRDGVRLLSWVGKPGMHVKQNAQQEPVIEEPDQERAVEANLTDLGRLAASDDVPAEETHQEQVLETISADPGKPGGSAVRMAGKTLYQSSWNAFGRRFISIRVKKVIGHLARGWVANAREFRIGIFSVLRDIISSLRTIGSFIRTIVSPFWSIAVSIFSFFRIGWRTLKQSVRVMIEALKVFRRFYSSLDVDGHFIVWKDDIKILIEADADIYVVFGNHSMSAAAANYCAKTKKKYVFSAGSEYDYYPEYATTPYERDMYGETYFEKNYAIMNASLHIVQTPRQAQMLKEGFGQSSIIVRNPIDLSSLAPRKENPDYVLWVGKSDERIKRPSLVLELARRMPQIPFVIVMNRSMPETYDLREAEARSLPNVTLIESVPYGEIENVFASARLFVSTSVFEGFPNTFLQAAKYGVPVVATDIDPGEMLTVHRAGITCGGDFDYFVESVQRILKDDALYSELSANALRYVREHHEKQVVITQYSDALMRVLA